MSRLNLSIENVGAVQSAKKEDIKIVEPHTSKFLSYFGITLKSIFVLLLVLFNHFLFCQLNCKQIIVFQLNRKFYFRFTLITNKNSFKSFLDFWILYLQQLAFFFFFKNVFIIIFLPGTEQNLMKVDFQINPVDVNAYYLVKVLTQPLDVFFHKVENILFYFKSESENITCASSLSCIYNELC